MHPALRSVDHRPWPLPARPWILRMEWRNLAFLHYPIDAALIQARLPDGLRVDTFGGTAWLGLVPFQMVDVTPRALPALPGVSTFPEVNVRTYVSVGGKPGVWFFSLDADSWSTVWAGRGLFNLPYFSARMRITERDDGACDFTSTRRHEAAVFNARYRPLGDVFTAAPGTFEHWATERYCLYAHSPRRGLSRLEVHHPPWPLQNAEVSLDAVTLHTAAGLPLDATGPVVHFCRGVPVVSYGPEFLA